MNWPGLKKKKASNVPKTIQCLSVANPLIRLCGTLKLLELLWPLSDVSTAKALLMSPVPFGISPSFPLSLASAVSPAFQLPL